MVHTEEVVASPALLKRASWGAILAGSAVGLALMALFGLLGLALGLAAIDPMNARPFSGIGTGTILWWIATSVVALGTGGFIAARLAGIPRGITAMLHGLSVWAVVFLLSLWIATSAVGKVVSMAASVVATTAETVVNVGAAAGGAAASGAGSLAGQAQLEEALREQGFTREQIRREAAQMLSAAGIGQEEANAAQREIQRSVGNVMRRPGTLDEEAAALIERLFGGQNAVVAPAERQRLVQEISRRAGVTPEEAERIAARWEQQAQAAGQRVSATSQQVRQEAARISEDALTGLSGAAWGAFIASIIGLVAALAGSVLGIPSLIVTRSETEVH